MINKLNNIEYKNALLFEIQKMEKQISTEELTLLFILHSLLSSIKSNQEPEHPTSRFEARDLRKIICR